MDHEKKIYTGQDKKFFVSWSKINSVNFKNYLKQEHNGFAILSGEKYIVVDYDLKHNPPREIYETLYANCEAVEQTPGGYHFWYLIDERTGHFKSITDAYWNNKEVAGLDIRAKGGICYTAPSKYKKEDGTLVKYAWIKGTLAGAKEIPSEVLEHLCDSAQEQNDDTFTFTLTKENTIGIDVDGAADDITVILNGLATGRADDYSKWINVGMALKNSGYGCDVWDEWSQRSHKYKAGVCDRKWGSFRGSEQPLTKSSLYSWLKEDNYELFISLVSAKNDIQCQLLTGTNASVAEVFHRLNPDAYIYSDAEGWYVLQPNNTWMETGSHDIFSIPNILNTIRSGCVDILVDILKQVNKNNDPVKQKGLADMIKKMGNTSFLKGAAAFLQGLYYKKGVEKQFNEKRDLWAFTDCALDLKTMELRPIVPEDYITVTCGYPYRAAEESEKELVMDFLRQILPDEAVRNYMLTALSKTLEGHNKGEWFHCLTGGGSNGKSKLIDLCAIVFGDYFRTIGVDYLTKDDNGKERPLPDLVKARWARMLVASEPEEKDRFQVSFMKLITGGDEISCRGMYAKHVLKFVPQFKLWIMANDIPKLSKFDQGIERRMRCVYFPTRFVAHPIADNERAIDQTLKQRMLEDEAWRYGFLGLLMEKFGEGKDRILDMPADVRQFTQNYMLANNPVGAWLHSYYERTGRRDDVVQKTEFYNQFLADTGSVKSQKSFVDDLAKCNVYEIRPENIRYYYGIRRKEKNDNNE